jgi:hypothetical protein
MFKYSKLNFLNDIFDGKPGMGASRDFAHNPKNKKNCGFIDFSYGWAVNYFSSCNAKHDMTGFGFSTIGIGSSVVYYIEGETNEDFPYILPTLIRYENRNKYIHKSVIVINYQTSGSNKKYRCRRLEDLRL